MISLSELSSVQGEGLNRKAIEDAHRKDTSCQQQHQTLKPTDLDACLSSIFYQSQSGYQNLPIEKMAGLLLYRIAEGQFFMDGNKRTALLSSYFFLHNNGLKLYIDRSEVDQLIWGFAKDISSGKAKFFEDDAIQYVFDNVMPRQ